MACHLLHAIINMPLIKLKGKLNFVKKNLKKRTRISQKNLEYIKNRYNSVRIQTIPFKSEKKILTDTSKCRYMKVNGT